MYFLSCLLKHKRVRSMFHRFFLCILCSDTPRALSIECKLPIIICCLSMNWEPPIDVFLRRNDCMNRFGNWWPCKIIRYKSIVESIKKSFSSYEHIVRFLILAVWNIKQQLACIWNQHALLQFFWFLSKFHSVNFYVALQLYPDHTT